MSQRYDVAIVGGGPGGAAAAIYAARKRLKTIFITSEWGGQSVVSSEIQNWVGTPAISGADLAKNLRAHVEAYAADCVTIVSPAIATKLTAHDDHVEITIADGTIYEAKTLLIATGSKRRTLEVPGAAQYDQKGLTYCATCDAPLFNGKDVAVVGGGNAAFETALQLLAYCKSVTLFNRTDVLRADEVTVTAALAHDNMHIIKNSEILTVEGSKFVSGLKWKDTNSGTESVLPVEGIFVEIGLLPNTDWVKDVVTLDATRHVVTDAKKQKTSHPRIWAAGDCTDGLYHQNNIAAGDAVKALEDIYMFLHRGV